MASEVLKKISCYHCGDDCDEAVVVDDKSFCCTGCRLVYEIVNENNLCAYYELNKTPGHKQASVIQQRFNFLDEPAIVQKLISFKQKNDTHVTLHIPSMHCSSCIWLLENFNRIDAGVMASRVDFLKKEIHLIFNHNKTSLRNIVEKLTQTGYEPSLHLDALEKKETKKANHSRVIRIGVAGFCFGNIMMMSFPEYFSSGKNIDPGLQHFFSYLNLFLALPVFFYSASEFFSKSWKAIKHKTTSIDIPIAIGIAAIFLRSAYEILSQTGAGYFDSGSGLVFFMLIGRWFQDYTFDALAFDRDYKSYFPIAVTTIKNNQEREVQVNELKINDRILIRNNEFIPVDALLLKGNAAIDYHFVTGESNPVCIEPGETIFAGGRQTTGIIEVQVTREVAQSHLTQLWNRSGAKAGSGFEKMVNAISTWFIVVTFTIAISAAAFWWSTDKHKAINAFTAVLVIACPCALALSAPFTYGNILRLLGKRKIYLRNFQTLEKLADIDAIVFDKTGTLTRQATSAIQFTGQPLMEEEQQMVYALVKQSSHPLSKQLAVYLQTKQSLPCSSFSETVGKGMQAIIKQQHIMVGSAVYTGCMHQDTMQQTCVYVSINNVCKGYFSFQNVYRDGIEEMTAELENKNFKLAVLTGDNESERENLQRRFKHADFKFNQKPEDKLTYIEKLRQHHQVLMIGDGLNDAGALTHATVGISVTDNTNSFTPASDAIMQAEMLKALPQLIKLSRLAVNIIIISFIISLLYNFIGLSLAVTGKLSPMLAAILMPISTISLVLFTVISSSIGARRLGF